MKRVLEFINDVVEFEQDFYGEFGEIENITERDEYYEVYHTNGVLRVYKEDLELLY